MGSQELRGRLLQFSQFYLHGAFYSFTIRMVSRGLKCFACKLDKKHRSVSL